MKLKGSVEEIRFRNEENGYTIATIDSRGEPIKRKRWFESPPTLRTG